MKRFVFLLSLFALVIAGCSQEEEQTAGKVIPVKIYVARADSISKYLTITGSITATDDIILYSKVSERISRLKVKPGDYVKKNQVLAVQYNEVLKQSVLAAETAVKNAEVQLELVKQDFDRMQKLHEQKAISPQQFDQISSQLKSAKLGYEQTKVQLSQTKEQLENSYVKAPFEGLVASVYIESSQMVPAGQPVIQLINKSAMKAKLKIPSKDINKVHKGQVVEAKFPSLPDKVFEGNINKIDQAVDPVSKSLQVEVIFDDSNLALKSGIFGEFYIRTAHKSDCIVIPENALQSRTEVKIERETGMQKSQKKYFLFFVKNNRADLKEVEAGISDDGRMEIPSGVMPGDTIVVVGQNIVKTGQLVKVMD